MKFLMISFAWNWAKEPRLLPIPHVHISSCKKECINPSHWAGDEELRGPMEESTSLTFVLCVKSVPGPLSRHLNKWSHFILAAALRG